MHRFDLNEKFHASGSETSEARIGEIYHVRRNWIGSGSVSTPIARYFVWRPEYTEGVAPHWRVDCYFRKHKLAGDPKSLSRLLCNNLQNAGLCEAPIWVSWHESDEISGESIGTLFADD